MWWLYFAISFLICWIIYEAVSGSWNYGAYSKGMMITSYVFLALSIIFAIGTIAGLASELMSHRKHIRMIHCKIAPEDCKKKVAICNKNKPPPMYKKSPRVNSGARTTFSEIRESSPFGEAIEMENVEAF